MGIYGTAGFEGLSFSMPDTAFLPFYPADFCTQTRGFCVTAGTVLTLPCCPWARLLPALQDGEDLPSILAAFLMLHIS